MRLGLIARAEDRGIGIQSWEVYRHLEPDRTLVIDMGELARGFPMHLDRYPDAEVVPFDGGLPERQLRQFLRSVDVVYMVETPYDYRLMDWARQERCATVVHANPEFERWSADPTLTPPTAMWVPTPWRLDMMPDAEVVPYPVAVERFVPRVRERADRFLHVAGHSAAGDRNGTRALIGSLRYSRESFDLVIRGQDAHVPHGRAHRFHSVRTEAGGVEHYWDLYADADVLVMPRRYGGLCLPVQEAMAAGLAVVMTDAEPQRSIWPVLPVPSVPRGELTAPGGEVKLMAVQPRPLAAAIDRLAKDDALVADLSASSLCWAGANSWAALTPMWMQKLGEAAAAI